MNGSGRIFAFHLLNDLSGSPKVLSQLLRGWVKDGYDVQLYTSLHQKGFLSDIEGVNYHNGWYRFKSNPFLRLIYFTLSQIVLFFNMMRQLKKTDLVYVNTVLPFGAALLGKIKGCRVIYHIHESTVNPAVLKWFLFTVVKHTASDIINVSKYVQNSHGLVDIANHLVYNSIDKSFLEKVLPKVPAENPKNVLMVCSLKAYKGLFEFLNLAAENEEYFFCLVLNASQTEIDSFFKGYEIPKNLIIYHSQTNLHPFYQWADVVLNLSRMDGWVETFGLTIVEGMAYGLPAIVPPVGGILEVIEDGITGFAVDARDSQRLNERLHDLLDDQLLYRNQSNSSKERLKIFREEHMIKRINEVLNIDSISKCPYEQNKQVLVS
jgi:L-malate glycosyltransferase